jgi:GT2 family glycosyltransferase
MIVVSIVSHNYEATLPVLVTKLLEFSNVGLVIVTLNIPQKLKLPIDARIFIIHNIKPKGFGANHNQAFLQSMDWGEIKWFCVMNPDVLWPTGAKDFWTCLEQDAFEQQVGLVCPKQVDEHSSVQDFARDLPTPWVLSARSLRRVFGRAPETAPLPLSKADWVNGACMVWRSDVFATLGGFDERYFMYCEDIDICLRMRIAGYRMESGPATVVHLAQRKTGKSWRHLLWHVRSLVRLWLSSVFWSYVRDFKFGAKFKNSKPRFLE